MWLTYQALSTSMEAFEGGCTSDSSVYTGSTGMHWIWKQYFTSYLKSNVISNLVLTG